MNEYQSHVVILMLFLSLLQVFLPLILAILFSHVLYCRKNRHYWRNCSARKTWADSATPNQACTESSHLYSPLKVLPLLRVQSQDDNELYSNLVESVVNVRQLLEGEFVDGVHVHKSEGVQGRTAKSKMWSFENWNMSLTVIEVLSKGYKLPFVQIPDSPCFIPNNNNNNNNNNSALHEVEFVRRAIEELLTKRCILEVDSHLYCCNPFNSCTMKEVAFGYRLESFGKQEYPVMQIQVRRFANLVGHV